MVKSNERRYVVRYEAHDFEKAVSNIQQASAQFTKLIGSSTSLLTNLKTVSNNFKINPKVDTTEVDRLQASLKESRQVQIGLAGVQDLKNTIKQLEINTKINLAKFQAYKKEVSDSVSPPEKKPFAYYQLTGQNQRMADVNIYELRRIRQAIVDGQNRKNLDRVGTFAADVTKVGATLGSGLFSGASTIASTLFKTVITPIQATVFGAFARIGEEFTAPLATGAMGGFQKRLGLSFTEVGTDIGESAGEAAYRVYDEFLEQFKKAIIDMPDPDLGGAAKQAIDKVFGDLPEIYKGLLFNLGTVPIKASQRIQINKKALPQLMVQAGQLAIEQEIDPKLEEEIFQKRSITLMTGGMNMDKDARNTEYVKRILAPVIKDTALIDVKNFWSNAQTSKEFQKFFSGVVRAYLKNQTPEQIAKFIGDIDLPEETKNTIFKGDLSNKENAIESLIESLSSSEVPVSKVFEQMYEGFNPDSIALAAQAMFYREKFPDMPINLVGTSGGGFAAAGAADLLKRSNVQGVKALGISSPPLFGMENLNNEGEYASVLGKSDFIYKALFGSQKVVMPPEYTQVFDQMGLAHSLHNYLADPRMQGFMKAFFGKSMGIKPNLRQSELNFISRLHQNPELENFQRTLKRGLGEPYDEGYYFNVPDLEGITREIKKKGKKVKEADLKAQYEALSAFLDALIEDLKIIEVLGNEAKPLQSLKLAPALFPELAPIADKYKGTAQITPEQKAQALVRYNDPAFKVQQKLLQEVSNIERTFKAMAGQQIQGYSFYSPGEELELRANEHLQGLINYLESNLLAGASAESTEEAQPYLDVLKELQRVILEMGQGAEYNTELAQKAAELFKVSLPGATYTPPTPQTSAQAASARAIENPFLGMSPEAKLLNLETRVSTEQAAEAYRSLTNIRGQRTPQELTNKVRSFREAIQQGNKRLATELGLNILRDIKAYSRAIEEIRQDPNANIRESAIQGLRQQFTAIANEIKRGSGSRGRTPVGQGLLDLIEQNEQEVIETIEAKILEELEVRRLAIEAQQANPSNPSTPPTPGTQNTEYTEFNDRLNDQLRRNRGDSEGGYFKPGMFIPSVRRLTADIDLSGITKRVQTFFANLSKISKTSLSKQAKEIKEYLEVTGDTVEEYIERLEDLINNPSTSSATTPKLVKEFKAAQELLNFQNNSRQNTPSQSKTKSNNPVKDWINDVSGSADKFKIDVNSIARNYQDLIQGLYRFNPLLGNIAELIQNLVTNFGEMAAATILINIWNQIGQQSVELVRQLQNVERAINTLTAGKGENSMQGLGEISKRTSTDLLVLADSYKQLVAATKGTSFEPFAMRFIDSFASLAASYGLDEQQKKQALTAFTQVFGKGKLQAEELTGQLAEAAPGFPQVIARGLGLTQDQLLAKVKEGGISATDAGLAFMRQAASEAGDVSQSYNTLQGSVNRLNNASFTLNKTLGEETAPKFILLKNILAFLTEQTTKFVPVINLLLSTLTVFLTGKAIESIFGLGASILGITKNTVGFVRVLKVLQAAFTALLNYVRSFVGVSTIGAVVLIEVWSSALQAVRQGTEQVNNANKSLAKSLKEVALGYREVKDASSGAGFQATDSTNRAIDFVLNGINNTLDFLGGGKEAVKRREAATGRKELRYTTFGESEFATNVVKTSDSVDKAYQINQVVDENLTPEKLKATSEQIKELDKRKANAQIALNYAQRNKNQADIDKYKAELVDLEKQKQQAIDEVNTYQSQIESVRTQLKNLLNYWKDLANNPDLTEEQQQQAQAQVRLLEQALLDVGKTADRGKASITGLAKAIGDLGLQLALINAKLQNFEYNLNLTTQRQKALIQQNLSTGTITSAQAQRQSTKADINTAEQRIAQLTAANKEYQEIYQGLDQSNQTRLQSALLKPLAEAGIGDIERIVSDTSIYDALDTNAKAALEARKKFLEGQTQIAQSQTELSTAQASLFETLKDFSRSYREFLLNASRQLEDLLLQTERELLNYKYQLQTQRNKLADLGLTNALESFRLELKKTIYQITTKTRGTVSTTFDGLLNALAGGVETAYENLRIDIQLKDTLNGFLQAIEEGLLTLTEQVNQFTRNQQDRAQAARDLAISNPTGSRTPQITNGAVRWIENSSSSSAAASGHMGDDIFAPIGSKIYSPVAGTIVQSRVGGTKNTDDADPTKPGYQPQQLIVVKLDMPIQFEGKTIRYLNMRHLLERNQELKVGSKVNIGDFLGTVGEAGGSGAQFGAKTPGTTKDADASHLHIEYSPSENVQHSSLTDAQASRLTAKLSEQYNNQAASSPALAGRESVGVARSTQQVSNAPTGQMSQQDWLRWVASQIGADPKDLAAIAALESARSFSSNKIGGAGNQYKGWIQMSPDAQRKLLGITDKNTQVTDEQYAKATVRYFTEFRKNTFNPNRQNSIWDLYKEINPGYSRSTFMRDVGDPNAPYRRSGEEWLAKDTTASSISVPAMGQNLSEEQAAAIADYGRSNNLITEADAQRIANLRQHTAETIELYQKQAQAETQLANTRKENSNQVNATEIARQRKETDQRLKDDQIALDKEKQRFATQARSYTQLQTSVRDYADQLDSLRQAQKDEDNTYKRQADAKRSELLNAQAGLELAKTAISQAKELNLSAEQLNEYKETAKRLEEVQIPLIRQQIIDNEKLLELSKENLKLGEAFLQREQAKGIISDVKNINATLDSVEELQVNYGLLEKATFDYDKRNRDLTETFSSLTIEIDEAIDKAKDLKNNYETIGDTKGIEKMDAAIKAFTDTQLKLNEVLQAGKRASELTYSADRKTQQADEINTLNKYRSQLDQLYAADMTPIDAAKYNARNAQIEQQTSYLEENANIDRLAASGKYGSEQIQQMRSDLEELNQVKLGQINNEADYLMVKLKEIAVSGISGVLNGFYDWIRGTKDLGEAFREVAISILDQIAQIALQIAVSGITGALFGTAQGKGGTQIKSSGGPSPWVQMALSAASSFAGGFAKGGAVGKVEGRKSKVGSFLPSTFDFVLPTSFAKGGAIGETWTSWGGSKNWGSFETPLNKITPPVVLPIQPPPLPLPIPLLPQIPIFSLLSFAKGGGIGDAIANEKKYGKKPMLAVVHKGEQVLSTLDGEAQQYRRLQQILGDSPLSKIKMSFATGGDLLNEIGSRKSKVESFLPSTFDFRPSTSSRQSTININTNVTMPPGSTSALTAQQVAARNAEAARRAVQRD